MMVADRDDNKANTLDEALTQFVNAYVRGEQPDIDEFVAQYPQHEAGIRQRIESLCEIDSLFDSIVQADEGDFTDVVTEPDLVGRTIGNFEIVEMIGRGGMGVVYLARDTKLDRSVAIKSMPADLAGNPNARMRLLREAKLLASLNHPNIAVIHEIIEEEQSGYLILEYVPGETLAQRIAHEPLKLEQALSIGQQITGAISAAHKKGIVHRDLKPGNIKITPDGRVKVLDFGLAKVVVNEGRGGEITVTGPGRVIGTPAYMSPEQARGEPADRRTDIWSFGCIMYQMLTGKLPFEGQTATDTLARIIEREPDWAALPQDTPTSIRTLVQRCLEKDPGRRPRDITEAITQITETLSTGPTMQPRKLTRTTMIVGAAVVVVLSIVGLWFALHENPKRSSKERRLVVLPFENLGPAAEEWFADGMTDEITTRLAAIHGLAVISRQSAIEFKKMGISSQIAKEFNLDYFLEGTVQCDRPSDPNSQVRIRIQLIKAADDTHVWQDTYDYNMSSIFQLQTDIAEKVAQALDITLLEPERKALTYGYIDNIEAYACFVRANQYYNLGSQEGIAKAIKMFEKAIELEPNYAAAHALLSSALTQMYWWYTKNLELLPRAKEAVDRALELEPDMPGAHVALGRYYYQGYLDYEHALEQFAIARRSHPNHVRTIHWTAVAQRRQGKFEEAIANHLRTVELDPTSDHYISVMAYTLGFLRRYEEAERYYEQAIRMAPDKAFSYTKKAWLYLLWQGDTKKARAVVDEALGNNKELASYSLIFEVLVYADIYDRAFEAAVKKLIQRSEDFDNMYWFIPNDLWLAEVYGYMGKEDLEKQYYQSATAILEKKVAEDPKDHRYHSSLGKAYAGLGREQEAIEQGVLGVECLPVTKDAMRGPLRVEDLARIYVMLGKYDEAIDIVERLLKMRSELSIPLLRLDPAWDPLRDHRRFKKLVGAGK
ncbi:MAG: protein kinase domain-containing protein [Planctomycetota bacterium]|jgi:serine/threonine protein kinase/Flp pilus assembly protein TadD